MKSWVILDRDGVINEDSSNFVKSADEWIPIDGSINAIARLSKAGYRLAVATNQSGLARGKFELDDLEAMHQKMKSLVEEEGGAIEAVFYCPHLPDDGCYCRKPNPGLLDALESEFETTVTGMPFVGDSLRDLQAAVNKGCEPVLVRSGNGKKTELQIKDDPSFSSLKIYDNLACFVDDLLNTSKPK